MVVLLSGQLLVMAVIVVICHLSIVTATPLYHDFAVRTSLTRPKFMRCVAHVTLAIARIKLCSHYFCFLESTSSCGVPPKKSISSANGVIDRSWRTYRRTRLRTTISLPNMTGLSLHPLHMPCTFSSTDH